MRFPKLDSELGPRAATLDGGRLVLASHHHRNGAIKSKNTQPRYGDEARRQEDHATRTSQRIIYLDIETH
jgi:hypothetical protein